MSEEVLPLAITMMAGPGIMAAIVFVTLDDAVRVSALYLLGVLVSTAAMTALWIELARLLGDGVHLGSSSDKGSAGTIIQAGLVALLVAGAIKTYLRRESSEPPKWLGKLLTTTPGRALRTGLLIIPAMPSDEVVMFTVGLNVVHTGGSFGDTLPFIGLTVLVGALPLLGYLLFRRRVRGAMPRVRDWMNDNSWAVNILVSAIFIVLILW